MLVSYKWLQTYFDEELPDAKELADILTVRAFEVESIERIGDDFVLDIDVLPNRAHDSLSHRGVAKELSVLLGADIVYPEVKPLAVVSDELVSVKNEEKELCRRYTSRVIKGVKVGPSPEWLKNRLEVIGQKSINNIVDATNYVMFDTGQPLHAFDADKVEGNIVIRRAKEGEKITTLDDKVVTLNSEVLIIADEKEPLAIAGVKGGKKAEVDEHTENIILEAANFAPEKVRTTSRRLNILTDSSKRFENDITPELTEYGMNEVSALIARIAASGKMAIGGVVDEYPRKAHPYKVGVSVSEINNMLGTALSAGEIEEILKKLTFTYESIVPRKRIRDIVAEGMVLGKLYRSGASVTYDAPEFFDCSSLSAWIYKEAGVAIPRISVDQYVFSERISESKLLPGDLIFANTGLIIKTGIYKESVEFLKGTKVPEGVDHVGIYVGDGKVLHTSSKSGTVAIEDLSGADMFKNIIGYGRVGDVDEERYVVTVPAERLDIRIPEDVIEEIGRIYGYENIAAVPFGREVPLSVNKTFYYVNKLRSILVRKGFSEIYTPTFTDSGSVEVENPIASDKRFLRSNLREKVVEAMRNNLKYADLLETNTVKVFEIGKVFNHRGDEHIVLCISIGVTKSKKGDSPDKDVEDTLEYLSKELGVKVSAEKGDVYAEVNVDQLVERLPNRESYEDALETYVKDAKYQKISPYPFITRDIALWVPEGVEEGEIKEIIKSHAGTFLVAGPRLFDRFEKKDKETGEIEKVSYAFRLVFQSQEKTLTDEEVNEIMNKITEAINGTPGWEVR